MTDRSIPVCNLITYTLWAWVATAIAAGWICTLFGQQQVALMLGLTACASSAIAATATIRLFTLRTQGLIRTMRDLDTGPIAAVTSLHTP